MILHTLKNNKHFIEIQENKRLQWLLLVVLAIVLLSAVKAFSDNAEEMFQRLEREQGQVARLVATANKELPEGVFTAVSSGYDKILETAPSANSDGIAEAQALKSTETLVSTYLKKGRSSLIGTERRQFGDVEFLVVRIELKGQMLSKEWVGFLGEMESKQDFLRISSLQYRPSVSNSMTAIVDYLYVRGE